MKAILGLLFVYIMINLGMVGIGSAPNTYLMTRAAELGRGAYTHIGSVDQVEERMRGLFAKLENPAVTGLAVKFSGASADSAVSSKNRFR